MAPRRKMNGKQVTVWIHKEQFSKHDVVVAPDIFGESELPSDTLMEIIALKPSVDSGDSEEALQGTLQSSGNASLYFDSRLSKSHVHPEHGGISPQNTGKNETLQADPRTLYRFIAKHMPADIRAKHPTLQVSITSSVANTFGYRQRGQAMISIIDRRACTASHVELIFRDQYLSRSDMWRLVRSDLAGKTVYKAQKILFLSSIKATVKTIYVDGQSVSSAYFSETTVPVFRSESARYVLFIQMSKEMWDFDSEGTGETLFSRVIDGFLPELFKKWVELEARHLVSIVLFGRLEYDRHGLAVLQNLNSDESDGPSITIDEKATYRDFYRVVVTDMASGQWTTILNALKKDFRVFLRDISLHQPREHNFTEGSSESDLEKESRTRICGQPTSALHGNILEAINIASSQFAADYIDRDLVRTGVSVIVITPGTGVFEVDRQLLELTSENLTNNGIGIDLVCLSKMPLHSVPLFKWLKSPSKISTLTSDTSGPVDSPRGPHSIDGSLTGPTPGSLLSSGSLPQSTPRAGAKVRVSKAQWSFGIPQWIDVSYWTPIGQQGQNSTAKGQKQIAQTYLNPMYTKTFVPRVRMYELQMMGVMELGLANISVPYLSESHPRDNETHNMKDGKLQYHNVRSAQSGNLPTHPRLMVSPRSKASVHSPERGRGLLSVQAKQQGDMYERMDVYDSNMFIFNQRRGAGKLGKTSKQPHSPAPPKHDSDQPISRDPRSTDGIFASNNTTTIKPTKVTSSIRSQALNLQSKTQKNANTSESRISRSISFALRGLGPSSPRAVASTDINVENVQAEHSASSLSSYRPFGDFSRMTRSPANTKSNRLSMLSLESEGSDQSDSGRQPKAIAMSPARPISIRNMAKQTQEFQHRAEKDVGSVHAGSSIKIGSLQDSHLQTDSPKAASPDSQVTEVDLRMKEATSPITADISPWIKTVNPSNPMKSRHQGSHWVGRWQHLYPYTLKTSTVKWKSLCTPASVPLTTEEFPSKEELMCQYIQTSWVISQSEDSELTEPLKARELLLREMIGLRLAHGYQLVVGRSVAKAIGTAVAASVDFYTPERLAQDGVTVVMSMGNTMQKLVCVNSTDVQVTRFVRRPLNETPERIQSVIYKPVIRTILSKRYLVREMTLAGFSNPYPWNLADAHLAGQSDDLTKVYDQLRFWRARFVLIPVEPPPSARRPIQSMSEDNEEEIHLLGIRELTKMWQKARYVPPEERRFKPTTGKRKDPNPLEISFQTLNPSEVVATEIEKLLATDDGAEYRQLQLLPESELLERSTSSLSKIAQMLQGEKGVEIANRRWHLRLHYSCFKGDDFTNWLLSSFKDIDTREEAVEFGNELMQHGLFHHVSTRHTFKDGNYFYTIAPEHRISRPESRNSWFASGRRPDRSVPPTPIIEGGSHVSPLSTNQSQSGWNSTRQADTRASEKGSAEKRQLSVSLTKMMRIDVDHRNPKRSDRPEIVNLHYDRLHNPENCYHFELAWLNVTSKLIEDAIVTWATQSEKYGLRLVEVPIAEACSITDREPFRAPYRITLKVAPPPPGNVMVYNGTIYFTNTSFTPQSTPSADKLIYQKALLKKFNFVLDLEAASDFPPDVDVTYTWGKLGYCYPQFVHRSGVGMAQITDEGDILLLANRLYNTRSASAKDAAGKFESKNISNHRPTPASSFVGLNAQNSSPHPSPLVRATSDVFGSRDALSAPGMANFITPEQIKDELEEFCHDSEKLLAFYKEVSERGLTTRKSGSTSSSVMKPVPEYGLESSIPDLRLPASVVATTTTTTKSLGIGLKKKSSPQPTARDRITPETSTTDFGRRISADSHC